MTQEEFDKAPKIEQVLYDCTGMLAINHSDIIEAMTIYAESEVKKLNIHAVINRRELLIDFLHWYHEQPYEIRQQLMYSQIIDKFEKIN